MQWVNGGISAIPDYEKTGIPSLEDVVAEYCRLTGRDGLPDLNWYFSYNIFRLAGICQGIVGRARDGTANSPQAAAMEGARAAAGRSGLEVRGEGGGGVASAGADTSLRSRDEAGTRKKFASGVLTLFFGLTNFFVIERCKGSMIVTGRPRFRAPLGSNLLVLRRWK